MDPLLGAAVAAAVAVVSILVAAWLPLGKVPVRRLRFVGAASLAGVGLSLLGVPLPSGLPAVVLVGGAGVVLALGDSGGGR